MKRKKKIVWTEEEINLVTEEALRLYIADLDNIWKFIAEAQEVLHEDRRRTIVSRAAVSNSLVKEFDTARNKFLEDNFPEIIQIEVEKEVRIEPSREELLENLTTEELLILLSKRFAPLIEKLPEIIAYKSGIDITSEKRPHKAFIGKQHRTNDRNKKVLLVNFLPGQEDIIRKKAVGLDLKLFFSSEKHSSGAQPGHNWVIMNIKSSHSLYHKHKKNTGSNRLFIVNGIDGAMKKLAQINSLPNK